MNNNPNKPLSIQEQVDLLVNKGLCVPNRAIAENKLTFVNYYRFNSYAKFFMQQNNKFKPNTTFDDIWQIYRFDRQLRCLIIDGVERIEIALKSLLINIFTIKYGEFGYNDFSNLHQMDLEKDQKENIQKQKDNIKNHSELIFKINNSLANHKIQINSPIVTSQNTPMWVAFEEISFGDVCRFFSLMKSKEKQEVAEIFKVNDRVLYSWLKSLNFIRNRSAHHLRIWNITPSIKPMLPKNWGLIAKNVALILHIIEFMLNIVIPQSNWKNRRDSLLQQFNKTSSKDMGY